MDTESKLCLLLMIFSQAEFTAAEKSSVPDLPPELIKGLEEILSEKYLKGLLNILQFQSSSSNVWTPDLITKMVAYLRTHSGVSISSLQVSLKTYLEEVTDDPKFLLSELRQLDSLQFQQVMKYLLGSKKEQMDMANIVVDFEAIQERIFQCPGGNRTIFLITLEKCAPAIGSSECVEILSQVVRMFGGSYLQTDVITSLPHELPEEPFRNLTSAFRDLYDRITASARRTLYEWMTQILQNTQMGNDMNGSLSWVTAENLWILGRYIVHLPVEEIQKINVNEIRMFISYDNATKQLDTVYDIAPELAKAFLDRINSSGFDMRNISTIYRLGLLVCFYDDLQDLDATVAKALLHQMMKCNQLKGFNVDVHKLKSHFLHIAMLNQSLNENLGSISDAVVGLTLSQLESLSPEAVQGAILTLQQVSGWTKSQIMVLAGKYLHSEKVLTFSNISQLGELASGIRVQSLYEMNPRELLMSLKGGLSQHASALSLAQQDGILSKVLQSGDFQTVALELNGVLFKQVPLIHLKAQKNLDIADLKDKEIKRSQALLLYKLLSHKTSLVDLLSTEQLVKGITCEQIDGMSKPTFLNHYRLLEKNIKLLSHYQINCLAWKYWRVSRATIPPFLLSVLPSTYFTSYPAFSCGSLLKSLRKTNIDYLIINTHKKNIILNKVTQCLNGSITDIYQLDKLGNLICHLSPSIIQTGISNSIIGMALNQFMLCANLSHEQNVQIKSRLLEHYGVPLNWTSETAQDMAPFWNLLSPEEFMSILTKFQGKVLQILSDAARIGVSDGMLLAIFDSVRILAANVSAPDQTAECEGVMAPPSDDIMKLGEANSFWSLNELECMDKETFAKNVHILGTIRRFSQSQLTVLKDKAKQLWGTLSDWKTYHLASLGRIVTALSDREIEDLDLRSIDAVSILGQQSEWNYTQAKAILTGFLNDSFKSASDLRSYELTALAGSLCAADPQKILHIETSEFSTALSRIGTLPCNQTILQAFKRKTEMIFGKSEMWTTFILKDIGYITAGLSTKDLKAIRPELMPYIQPSAIKLIPDQTFKVLSPEQIANLGPENAAMVTASQRAELDQVQLQSLNQALDGVRASIHKPEQLTTVTTTTAIIPPTASDSKFCNTQPSPSLCKNTVVH
ncbi:otoancorin [Bombina bombina]|uniref:otoancorin n=1 Tax=Bombina bombina TaxID=8345 RepID=UPI00235B08EF|nr:otoancorin [Bombina bombina]